MSVDPDYLEKELPNLFHEASVSMTQEQLANWLASAIGLAEALEPQDAPSLVLAAHGRDFDGTLRERAVEEIRSRHEATYPSEGRDREIEILCTAAVIHSIVSMGGLRGSATALCALTANFCGWKNVATDLPTIAIEYLDSAGAAVRRRRSLPENPPTDATLSKAGGLRDVSWTTPMEAHPFIAAHSSAIRALGKWAESTRAEFTRRQRLVDEELDLLWWAINGRSAIAAKSWADISPGPRAFFAGVEAGDRTVAVPGPPSARILINRVLGNAEEVVEVSKMVKGLVKEWPQDKKLTDWRTSLLPIFTSFHEARELEGDNAWQKVVSQKHRIDLPKHSTTAELAIQTYRERLLLAVLRPSVDETGL